MIAYHFVTNVLLCELSDQLLRTLGHAQTCTDIHWHTQSHFFYIDLLRNEINKQVSFYNPTKSNSRRYPWTILIHF